MESILRKTALRLDFVQITSSPPLALIWTTCTTFFRRRNPRFESQFFSQDTFPKKGLKLFMTNPHQEPVNLEEGA